MSEAEFGCRSPLVLAKLGFDLRSCYQATLDEKMPDRLQRLCDELMGFVDFEEVSEDGDEESR